MKWLTILLVVILGLACSKDSVVVQVEDPPSSSVPIATHITSHFCFTEIPGRNIPVYHIDTPTSGELFERDPSQNWIDGYFKPQIENKRFYMAVSFPDDTVAIRLFIPGTDSTRIRQAFISETEIIKPVGTDNYSAGYLYPPGEELHISWDFTDSRKVRVMPGWYAFCTEFVEEGRAIIFWFKYVAKDR